MIGSLVVLLERRGAPLGGALFLVWWCVVLVLGYLVKYYFNSVF